MALVECSLPGLYLEHGQFARGELVRDPEPFGPVRGGSLDQSAGRVVALHLIAVCLRQPQAKVALDLDLLRLVPVVQHEHEHSVVKHVGAHEAGGRLCENAVSDQVALDEVMQELLAQSSTFLDSPGKLGYFAYQ